MMQARDFAGASLRLVRLRPHPTVVLYSRSFLRDFPGFPLI